MAKHATRDLPPISMLQVASGSGLPSATMYNSTYLVEDHSMPMSLHTNMMRSSVQDQNFLRPPHDSVMPTTAADLMREGPRDFAVIKDVGDGSFGTVCLADWKSPLPSGTMLSPMQHPTTRPEYIGKRLVAIKKMKKPFPNWQECMKLKELKSLLTIPAHPNIIPLYDAFLMPTTKELHFVFECMEGNLYQLTKSRKGRPLAAGLVASIYEQIVLGLDHIHAHGYFHRDMKPENLLITTTGLADYPAFRNGASSEKDVLVIVKLADFGLARETHSSPPYTEYVSTRWYRAPEVLLRSRDYSNPVDMWALGTILAELVNLKPLFPGQSEVDQVLQICEILGDPSHSYGLSTRDKPNGGGSWDRGIKMARAVGFQFPIHKPVPFAKLFSDRVPISLVECIEDLLRYEPSARLTSGECLRHDYMLKDAPLLRPARSKPAVSATAPARLQPISAATHVIPPTHSAPLLTQIAKSPMAASLHLQPLAALRQPQESMTNGLLASPLQMDGTDSSQSSVSFPLRPPAGSEMHHHHRTQARPNVVTSDSHRNQQLLAGRTVYDDDLTAAYTSSQSSSGAAAAYGTQHGLEPAFRSHERDANAEQAALRGNERQGVKSWFSSTSISQYAAPSMSNSGSTNGSTHMQPQLVDATPAQRIAAEHATAPTNSPAKASSDPKKAKKEAEKAAREAEKAKREAQQKAARDRARAVMQKRNQLLSSSNGRDAVEWMSGNVQSTDAYPANPSEKARGKLPTHTTTSSAPGMPGYPSLDMPRSPQHLQGQSLSPDYGLSPHLAVSPSMAWRGTGGTNRSNKARRREFDDDHSMSSFEDVVRTRRLSMQSYQTGESDPGPKTGQHQPPNHVHRASSSSSLAAAPPILDTRRFAPSLESHRSSAEVRSINSLDHQLITNLENMTAAEAWSRTPVSGSPAATHSNVSRPSVSRQSRSGSRASSASVHRQGSASPLHHAAGIPRFHPYSNGQPVPYHTSYQLPSMHQSVQQGRTPDWTEDDAIYGKPHTPGSLPYATPIFNVSNGDTNGLIALPPFSHIAGSVDVHAPSNYGQPRSPTHMLQD